MSLQTAPMPPTKRCSPQAHLSHPALDSSHSGFHQFIKHGRSFRPCKSLQPQARKRRTDEERQRQERQKMPAPSTGQASWQTGPSLDQAEARSKEARGREGHRIKGHWLWLASFTAGLLISMSQRSKGGGPVGCRRTRSSSKRAAKARSRSNGVRLSQLSRLSHHSGFQAEWVGAGA